MKKITIYSILLLGSVSCTDNDNQTLKTLTSKYTYLHGKVLLCDSLIESSYIVAFFDNKIVTRRFAVTGCLTMYNSTNDSITKVASFARRGRGPFEFQESVECYFDQSSNIFYIFDIGSRSLLTAYQIDISSIENFSNVNAWKPINISTSTNCFWDSFVPLSDSVWIALGGEYDKTNLLSSINPKDSILHELPILYPQDGVNVPPIIKRYLYNEGELLKKPSSNSKFLYYCTDLGNYAEIITINDDQSVGRQIIANVYPDYTIAPDGMNKKSSMNTLMGMASYVTDSYIYLLPNFRTKKEYLDETNNNGSPSNHANAIYVFDWDGNFVKAYKLSKFIRRFVVCPDDSYILGSCDDLEDTQIIKFCI